MNETYQKLCMIQGRIGRMRHRIIDSRIQKLGIHPSQHFLLVHLSRMGRTPSQAKLAEELNVSPALVARTLKNLESGGYIQRLDSATDGRRNEICITPEGERVLEEGKNIFREIDACSFAGFSEEELETYTALLEKALENIIRLEQAQKEEMRKG